MMLTSTTLQQRISSLLKDKVNLEVPSPETDLLESGLLDSLTLVELMTQLETEFEIRISFEDIELDHFHTVVSMANFIEHRTASPQASAA